MKAFARILSLLSLTAFSVGDGSTMVVDNQNRIVITDRENHRIQIFSIESEAASAAAIIAIVQLLLGDSSGLPGYSDPIPLSSFGLLGRDSNGHPIGWLEPEVADLNGDGFEDFVMAKSGPLDQQAPPLTPLIALNDGLGSFIDGTSQLIAEPIPEYFLVRDILVADFNGDDQLDIFFSNQGLEYDIGNGEFPCEKNGLLLSGLDGMLHDVSDTNLPDLQDFSHGSSAADIDGDNDIDIWVNNLGCNNGPPSYLLENNGSGVFIIVANGPGNVDPLPPPFVGRNGRLPDEYENSFWSNFLDADNDGDEDLYLNITDVASTQTVLINDGSGSFEMAPETYVPDFILPAVQDSVAADINNDGRDDLILMQNPNNFGPGYALQLLVSHPTGGLQDETELRLPTQINLENGAGNSTVQLGDLNGDNRFDILVKMWTNDFAGKITDFYLNDGNGMFSRLPASTFQNVSPLFIPIDVTNDGYTDFIFLDLTSSGENQLSLIRAQPTGH